MKASTQFIDSVNNLLSQQNARRQDRANTVKAQMNKPVLTKTKAKVTGSGSKPTKYDSNDPKMSARREKETTGSKTKNVKVKVNVP